MTDVYQRVTDSIIAAIERGAGDWRMPWHVRAGEGPTVPTNIASGKAYRGVNILALWAEGRRAGYSANVWGTYKQWAERGAQVRKGEHGSLVVFWKFDDRRSGNDAADDSDAPSSHHRAVLARGYTVFNAQQVDGFTLPSPAPVIEPERDARADAWFQAIGANVRHGGTKAYYSPSQDFIAMPQFADFIAPVHYYSTLAHEITHWTGHASRCERDFRGRFGDEHYAAEELVAELGAAFQCAILQLDSEPRPDHAQYVANWLRVLKNDKRAIFTASSKAQTAVDWLAARQPVEAVPLPIAA